MNSTRPAAADAPASEASSVPCTTEFSVRIRKTKKKMHVMKFNKAQNVDFKEWKGSKMERENNMKDFKRFDEDMPKFGAGSEFGRNAREEARRKKFGITSKKYKAENQPWILKPNGKTGKKFKGNRDGGVNENASYYVFVTNNNGTIDAYPLNEWYNFQPIQTYKTLSAEEAEEEFNRRDKVLNYFSVMVKKRLRNDEEDAEDSEQLEGKKGKKLSNIKKKLKISEMDEWMSSDDDDDSDMDEKEDKNKSDDEDDKKKKKKKGVAEKKKKNVPYDEAFEESDDGDEEGRECDYISDSSASEDELESQKEIKSVAEEDALRKLLASDEEDEDEEEKEKKNDAEKSDDADGDKDDKSKEKKSKNTKKGKKKDTTDSSTDSGTASAQSSRSATPTIIAGPSGDSSKRPLDGSPGPYPTAKKMKTEINYKSSFSGSNDGVITEGAIRRYLMRKPMTPAELAHKFKTKKTGLSSEQICDLIGAILKKINPIRQKIKDKMYLSLKPK